MAADVYRAKRPSGLDGERLLAWMLGVCERVDAPDYVMRAFGPCMFWQHSVNNSGRPTVFHQGAPRLASRLAWSLDRGRDIRDGYVVAHRCDAVLCIEPRHLLEQRQADNNVSCGRRFRTGKAKLTSADEVRRMRRLRSEGWTGRELASEFGYADAQSALCAVRNRYRHVA